MGQTLIDAVLAASDLTLTGALEISGSKLLGRDVGERSGRATGVAITADAATATEGTWQYSTNGGTNWTALPSVSAASAFLLNGTALLRFVPTSDARGADTLQRLC